MKVGMCLWKWTQPTPPANPFAFPGLQTEDCTAEGALHIQINSYDRRQLQTGRKLNIIWMLVTSGQFSSLLVANHLRLSSWRTTDAIG